MKGNDLMIYYQRFPHFISGLQTNRGSLPISFEHYWKQRSQETKESLQAFGGNLCFRKWILSKIPTIKFRNYSEDFAELSVKSKSTKSGLKNQVFDKHRQAVEEWQCKPGAVLIQNCSWGHTMCESCQWEGKVWILHPTRRNWWNFTSEWSSFLGKICDVWIFLNISTFRNGDLKMKLTLWSKITWK